jgi:Tol biopolymer transport system component
MRTTRWTVCFLIAAIAWLTTSLAGQNDKNDRQAQAALQAAVNKENVDGNLDAAIKQYKEIVSRYASQRAIVADALIHMAEAYQKQGDAQAQKIFEQIVREYGDQTAATAKARAHLGFERASGTATVLRKVWSGPDVDAESSVSPDGRYISYPAWDTGDLAIHDMVTGTNRLLTNNNYANRTYAENSSFSRDGRQLAYAWFEKDHYQLRLSNWQSAGNAQPRILYDNPDLEYVVPYDWSPDGKWIAAQFYPKDNTPTQIGLVSVPDGSARILTTLNSILRVQRPRGLFVSPDGKYLAFDQPTTENNIDVRDVFVIPVDGNGKAQAVVRDVRSVVGWSPEGTRLLFMSDRAGTGGLWALPFADGKVQEPPELLKSDIGPSLPLGVTVSGALYVYKHISSRDIAIAPIDLEAGRLLGPPVSFTKGFIEDAAFPNWSPDGKFLAYPVPCDNGCFAIRSVATGQVRRVAPTLAQAYAPSWSPDGRSLLARGKDANGRQGIFQIDVATGVATAVVLADASIMAQWAPTGKKVYYRLSNRGLIVERDLVSGAERDVYAGEAGILSPDGQYFSVASTNASTKVSSLQLIPVAGGQPREFLRLTQPEALGGRQTWTPDSRAVMFDKNTGSHMELWLAPISGGQPRKLDIDPDVWLKGSVPQTGQLGFTLSPDGRNIAVYTGTTVSEVWALENFLPATVTKK